MFHKEGFKIIIISFIITSSLAIAIEFFLINQLLKLSIQIILIISLILILQFFRNPKRELIPDKNKIISPVDGKIVIVESVYEDEYFKDKRKQVSIFMSPLNVHVTRYPASGRITYNKYHPGKYLVAWHPKSSKKNERTTVVINTEKYGEIMYRQIAGAVARRIINYSNLGNEVVQGKDAGFIKFGSRVDIFLPLSAKIKVNIGDVVKGAKSIISDKI
ncbi:MAG: phosphatidylserine decarboxylase family protein [Flavobacteriaceae bacterium]|nr:phosphatidylserine decarboxylase family protein [Flavobacteriaceae bacterium]|tara:strand:- start:20 stop:673 length:654 start_codon:yes stop_codon:yes gene_type:complete